MAEIMGAIIPRYVILQTSHYAGRLGNINGFCVLGPEKGEKPTAVEVCN